jgi:hypothetical protein
VTGSTGRPGDDRELTDGPAGAVPDDDVRLLDSGVRRTLRDLIPDYSGPPDPLLRVSISIRRRRSRRRALLAVGSAATAAALVAAVPAVLATVLAGNQWGGVPPAAGRPSPVPSGVTAAPAPTPPAYPVNQGTVAGAAWRVVSTSPGGAARRCLLSDGGGLHRDTVCFDDWRRGDPLSWHLLVVRFGSTQVTRVTGVAPAGAAMVLVEVAGASPVWTKAVPTPTDSAVRFFATVLEGKAEIRSVTPMRDDRTPLGPPVTEPAAPSCWPAPDNACASPEPTG